MVTLGNGSRRSDAADSQGLATPRADRIKDCETLSQAFGLEVVPYYQDPSKGPEQDILYYQINLLGQGILIDYSKVMAIQTILVEPGQHNVQTLGLDTRLEKANPGAESTGRAGRHLGIALLVRSPLAQDNSFLARIASPAVQQALEGIRSQPINHEVARIAREVDELTKQRYADKGYSFSQDLVEKLQPHL